MRRLGLLSLLAFVACTPPSASRAELDRDVGTAAAAGVELEVEDGLATVRALSEQSATLWCSAPVVTLTLDVDTPRSFALDLQNTMTDVVARATDDRGETIAVALEEGSIATRKRVRLELGTGRTTLRLQTPDATDRTPWRFALMSDVQGGIDEIQDVFDAINREPDLRFLLGAGDLASSGSREELERFRAELESLAVPYYTTIGNHDSPETGLWQKLYGRGNFRFVFRGVQFTMLDSASATIDPLAYDWLDGWLEEGLSRVNIFAMHIPALDPVGTRNGAFGSRNEAGKLLSRLHAGNVAMTLYGHIHSFYQFENGGIPAFISGGGGALPEKGDGYGRHYLRFEVGADAGVVEAELVEVD